MEPEALIEINKNLKEAISGERKGRVREKEKQKSIDLEGYNV